jgi:hypothetical protein
VTKWYIYRKRGVLALSGDTTVGETELDWEERLLNKASGTSFEEARAG